MDVHQTNIFTGIPEIYTEILLNLDNKELYNICQVNNYSAELCYNDSFKK